MAWTFQFPWMFVAAAAAVIPLLLFLLQRRQVQRVDWGAMQFLESATRGRSRRLNWRKLLLLMVRMALPLAIALAATAPYLTISQPGNEPAVPAPIHWILVLDDSASMAYQKQQETCLDEALDECLRITDGAAENDLFTLITSGLNQPTRPIVASSNRQLLQQLVSSVRIEYGSLKLDDLLDLINDSIDQGLRNRARQSHIVFLSDLASHSWAGSQDRPTAKSWEGLLSRAKICIVGCGDATRPNIGVTRLDVSSWLVTLAQPVLISATVSAFDIVSPRPLQVQLLVDDEVVESQSVSVNHDNPAQVSFRYLPDSPGDHLISVVVEGDSFPLDDRRSVSVSCLPKINLLCVEGTRDAARNLVVATDITDSTNLPVIDSRVVSANRLESVDLRDTHCVCLADVSQLSSVAVDHIMDFARNGGSLIVFPAADVDDEFLPGLFQSMQKIADVPAVEFSPSENRRYQIDPLQFAHPMVAAFKDFSNAGLLDLPVWRFHRAAIPGEPRSDVQRVLNFDDGSPAVVVFNLARGKCVLITTPLDSGGSDGQTWNALAQWWSFLPLVNEMITWCFNGSSNRRNLMVGDTIEMTLADSSFRQSWQVIDPQGVRSVIQPVIKDQANQHTVPLMSAELPGVYTVSHASAQGSAPKRANKYSVNIGASESNTTRAELGELRPFIVDPLEMRDSAIPASRARPAASVSLVSAGTVSVTGHRNRISNSVFKHEKGAANMIIASALIAQSSTGIQHNWWQPASPLPLWVWCAVWLFIGSAVIFMYWKQPATAKPVQLASLCLLRLLALLITVVALINMTRAKGVIELPVLSIVLDCSESSSFVDQRGSAEEPAIENETSGLASATRISRAKGIWLAENGRLLRRLSKNFRLKFYCAGSKLDAAQIAAIRGQRTAPAGEQFTQLMQQISDWLPNQKESLLGSALVQVINQNSGTTSAGIVLFSDGALTGGKSFEAAIRQANRYKMPVYTVGLGDHRRPQDIEISHLQANDRVLANELLDVTCKIAAYGFAGKSCDLQARGMPQGTLLASRQLEFDSDDFSANIQLRLSLENQGQQTIEVGIRALDRELSADNNYQSKVVEVINRSMRVLLIQEFPTPEFRFLKQALTRATNSSSGQSLFDVEYLLQSADTDYEKTDSQALGKFPKHSTLNDYDVIILGDVSLDQSGQARVTSRDLESLVDYVSRGQGNLVFVPGSSATPNRFGSTPLGELLPFDQTFSNTSNRTTLIDGRGNFHVLPTQLGMEFSPLVSLQSESKTLQELAPMRWRFVPQSLDDSALVMAELVDAGTANNSRSPAISFQRIGSGIVIVHYTDEFYRWRFRNDQPHYSGYWSQLIRYLVNNRIRRVDEAVTIQTSRLQYPAGQAVAVRVTVADASAVSNDENSFALSLEDESGNVTPVFCGRDLASREILRFEALLENLNPGHYRVKIADDFALERPADHEFEVTDHPLELFELRMQKVELENLAQATGGTFVSIDNVNQLWPLIPKNRWTQVQRLPSEPVWYWWVVPAIFAILLVSLLTTEWLLRRKFEMI